MFPPSGRYYEWIAQMDVCRLNEVGPCCGCAPKLLLTRKVKAQSKQFPIPGFESGAISGGRMDSGAATFTRRTQAVTSKPDSRKKPAQTWTWVTARDLTASSRLGGDSRGGQRYGMVCRDRNPHDEAL